MKTCVISFSSRADGNCAAIADCVQETLGAEGLTRFDFSGLSLQRCVSAQDFLTVFTVVISFYFGTQHERSNAA